MKEYVAEAIDKVKKVSLHPAKFGLDLGDGSERGEYVNQDYILHKLGRPHRYISLMYTYYPNDEQWPQRISEACKDMEIHFQWDYPYDDYFPYGGGIGGDLTHEPFNQMRDIRRHGQDVALTLTIDCGVSDEHLIQIAKELSTFGRMRLRINHECTGTWFTHNRRYSIEEISAFFVRFSKILKKEAPNVATILCAGLIKEDGTVEYEKEMLKAYKAADIWSADSYPALHYGWPFDVCEKGCNSYATRSVEEFYTKYEATAKRLREVTGQEKPLVASEFNIDGDVTGPKAQGEALKALCAMIKSKKPDWFGSFSMYQFRDRGRLGLEIQDPNYADCGIEQPILRDYKEIMDQKYFKPEIKNDGKAVFPAELRWGGSEDADGIALTVTLEKEPVFFELEVEEDLALMIEVNGKWFYKAPSTKIVDLMSAFMDVDAKEVKPGQKVDVRIFATPKDGENPQTDAEDWATNYRVVMNESPKLRVRYAPVALVKKDKVVE